MRRSRDLVWDGCLNVRDLGGHRVGGGGETAFGRVVRADSVRQLTEAGWHAAVDYGVRSVVDLRDEEELRADPPGALPVEVVHVPFLEFRRREVLAEVDAASAAAPNDTIATRDVYLLFLEHFRSNVARAVAAVARAPEEGAVVVHCMGGKDRTGLVTAFLLDLAGVDHDAIGADYALSETRLRPRAERWIAEAGTEEERARLRRVAATPKDAIVAVLAELGRRYGGVEGYLLDAGMSGDEVALIRSRLRA